MIAISLTLTLGKDCANSELKFSYKASCSRLKTSIGMDLLKSSSLSAIAFDAGSKRIFGDIVLEEKERKKEGRKERKERRYLDIYKASQHLVKGSTAFSH